MAPPASFKGDNVARYISKYPAFKKTVRHAQATLIQGPQGPTMTTTRQATIAYFRQHGLADWELEEAKRRFNFLGVMEGEAPAENRCSYFDTDEQAQLYGWDADAKAEIEELLDLGQSSDYFRVDRPLTPMPWASYHDMSADQVLEFTRAGKFSPTEVAAYERENDGRYELLEGLAEMEAGEREIIV